MSDDHPLRNILAIAGVLGLIFYGGALIAYSQFYSAFGIAPDEIGFSYSAAFTRLIPAFFLWLYAWVILIFTLVFVGFGSLFVIAVALDVVASLRKRFRREHPPSVGADAPSIVEASAGEPRAWRVNLTEPAGSATKPRSEPFLTNLWKAALEI